MCFVLIRLPAQSEERRKVRGKLIFAPHKCMVYSILKLGFIKMYQQELEHMHRSCWQQANTSRMCRWLRHQKHKWIREGWDLWNIKPNLFNPGVCKNPIPHHGPLTGPTRVWPLINSFQPHSLLRKSSLPNKSKGATPPHTHTHTKPQVPIIATWYLFSHPSSHNFYMQLSWGRKLLSPIQFYLYSQCHT